MLLKDILMFIACSANFANGFLKPSKPEAQRHSNDNNEPGGSTPVSLADPLASVRDALLAVERTGST